MHHHAQFVALEIDAIIPQAKTVQGLAAPLQFAESLQLSAHHFLRQTAKLSEDMQLQFFWHSRQLTGAGGIKDDLEQAHDLNLVARTGIAPVFQP